MTNTYCTNCATQLIQKAKFCQSCGAVISKTKKNKEKDKASAHEKVEHAMTIKPVKDSSENAYKETVLFKSKTFPITFISKQSTPINGSNKEISTKEKIWILYYAIVMIPIYLINTGEGVVLGVLIFSVVVLYEYVVQLLKKKKGKYNLSMLKVIMIIQIIFAVFGIIQRLGNIGSSGIDLIAVISLVLLIFLNIKIILKRSK